MGLYEKMFNVMNDSEAIEKKMEVGKGVNAYKAVSEAAILNMVKPLFKQYKLIIFPVSGDIQEIVNVYNKTDYDKNTSENQRAITQLKVMYRIMDIESGEFQDVVGFGNGADSQDKGAGKAFTYSLKNVLSKTFMLFSGEDTDNTHSDDIGADTTQPKTASDKPPTEIKITTQMLEDIAKLKHVPLDQLTKRYTDETGKQCSEIKFISQDKKQEYYDMLKALVVK